VNAGGTLVLATWCQREETPEHPLTAKDKSDLQYLYDEWAHPYFISIEEYKRILEVRCSCPGVQNSLNLFSPFFGNCSSSANILCGPPPILPYSFSLVIECKHLSEMIGLQVECFGTGKSANYQLLLHAWARQQKMQASPPPRGFRDAPRSA
jgi:hypothetical protein